MTTIKNHYTEILSQIESEGLYKQERTITTPQGVEIATAKDGVFSMDGYIAKLDKITTLAEKYNTMVMVDDSHATGFVGKTGRGSAEHCGVMDKIDIFTSTLGKALGGASGGFTTGRQEIINLFFNSILLPIFGYHSYTNRYRQLK